MEISNGKTGAVPNRGLLIAVTAVAVVFSAVWLAVFYWSFRQADASTDVPARRAARGEHISLSIKARQRPIELRPVPGLAGAVTDEELMKSLCAALPWWNPPTVPSLIHELKLWGCNARFTKGMVPQERTGANIVAILLSDELCCERTTPDGSSYLLDSPFGIHVALMLSEDAVGTRAEGHFGQLLAVLGEAGVPLDRPVTTVSGRTGTVADLLQDAILRFGWTGELEFIATAIALWLPPEKTWTDQFGNRYSFDELLEHLVNIPFGVGACGGTHVAYAVVAILHGDDECHVLSPDARKKGLAYLAKASGVLGRSQLGGGGWDSSWPRDRVAKGLYGDSTIDEINITGHHLEWIAMAPGSVRPSMRVVALATSALVRQINALPPLNGRTFKTLLPCSHAARALCLLRGQEPYQTWKECWDRGCFKHVSPWSDRAAK